MALQADERTVLMVGGLLVVLALLYGVFVTRAPLELLGLLVPLLFLYLLWRFVRAHERIADALEGTGTTDSLESE